MQNGQRHAQAVHVTGNTLVCVAKRGELDAMNAEGQESDEVACGYR